MPTIAPTIGEIHIPPQAETSSCMDIQCSRNTSGRVSKRRKGYATSAIAPDDGKNRAEQYIGISGANIEIAINRRMWLASISNDEVERRGVAPTKNEADLSQSSTASLAHRRRGPRSLEPIVRFDAYLFATSTTYSEPGARQLPRMGSTSQHCSL